MYEGWIGFLYRIAEWVMRLAYANILWILFTLVGLIVGGVFPATVGLYTVVRQWLIKEADTLRVGDTFWHAYRREFIRANIVGYVYLIIGWILFIDLKFFQIQGDGLIFLILSYVFLVVFILYIVLWLMLFPAMAHFDLKPLQYLKQTLFIAILRPMELIMLAAGFVIVYYLMSMMPVLIIFFSMSLLALVTMWAGLRAFNKLQLKIEKQQQKKEHN